ncbi:MAG: tRNA 4-thiouridine(8) synthase ThiI [Clostridia bacterium]|nr:tRNA 4-thiouridine(8) synthase ThiI [Clostridia bacterium]
MNEVILLKDGELALKGLNRSRFESALIKTVRARLARSVGEFTAERAQSITYLRPVDPDVDMDRAIEVVSRVFGVVGISHAAECEKDIEVIERTAEEFLGEDLLSARTFKVNAKRGDKTFALKSPAICEEVGGYLLSKFSHLKVDVHDPDVIVNVEVRARSAYVHGNQLPGAGGLPSGTSGKACVLISGGIDSPVAAWMMARRGMRLVAVHFASPPYTSQRALLKVESLLKKVSEYAGRIDFFVVNLTEIQESIRDNAPEDMLTIVMRRAMMKIANGIAKQNDCSALVTGESVGQVASQTVSAIACTDVCADMPVFRPLIGMDKSDIIRIANDIDTFETSILPYEDCCTVFTPPHPKTHPQIRDAEKAENMSVTPEMIQKAIETAERYVIDV